MLAPFLRWEGNAEALKKTRSLLQKSVKLLPSNSSGWLHLAEVDFALGDRDSASHSYTQSAAQLPGRSPFLDEKRYEAQLIQAWAAFKNEDWDQAVDHFRLGLFWGGENPTQSDEEAYFKSLAFQAKDDKTEFKPGIFSILAGEQQTGIDLLKEELTNNNPQNNELVSLAYLYLAKGYSDLSDYENAEDAAIASVYLNPENRLAIYSLLQIYQLNKDSGKAKEIEQKLNEIGPGFPLGLHSGSYHEDRPARLPSGWTLVGYDLDETLLEDAHRLEALLWWQAPENIQPGEGFLPVGDYWIQIQELTNLLPNPGMEWGLDENGLPLGYDREFYGAPEDRLVVTTEQRSGSPTQVLAANNSTEVPSIALTSRLIQLDPLQVTLMAGWVKDEGSIANIGRNCWGREFQPGYPYYIGFPKTNERPKNSWIHLADLQQIVPGEKAETCEVLLINFMAETPAMWDNVFWAVVETP